MTVYTLDAGLPAAVLPGGSKIRFEAISPTTGAAITGVTVADIAIYGYNRSDGAGTLAGEVPRWTPTEVEGLG